MIYCMYETLQEGLVHENVHSSVIHSKSRTPLMVVRPTPRRPPPGLPKTPMTLPRMATRRSPRLYSGQLQSPCNQSTKLSSRRNLSTQVRSSPRPALSTRNKLSFLIWVSNVWKVIRSWFYKYHEFSTCFVILCQSWLMFWRSSCSVVQFSSQFWEWEFSCVIYTIQ